MDGLPGCAEAPVCFLFLNLAHLLEVFANRRTWDSGERNEMAGVFHLCSRDLGEQPSAVVVSLQDKSRPFVASRFLPSPSL